MPKLVIKQDVGTAGRQARQGKWLSLGGLLLLLIAVAGAAYFFTRPVITSPVQQALVLDSAQDQVVKAKYLSMHQVFNALGGEYEKLSSQGLDDYGKNVKLLGKSGEILLHLDEMSALTDPLGLDDDERQQLFNRHQFNKDYWQAKSHFRQLRVSRFENGGKSTPSVVEEKITSTDKPKKFQFAKPPAGMELPEGFCDLSNPGNCKPETAEVQGTEELLPLPADDAAASKPKKKFQFAKPPAGMALPEGFCDLSNPGSCKPETAEVRATEELLPLPTDIATDDTAGKPKKKFQFAKPPAGMELPEGFCDLSNPGSCKPETAEVQGTEELLPLPADDTAASKPKKKFQFAKPPAGMKLPEGFCDLSNPGSCKPEATQTLATDKLLPLPADLPVDDMVSKPKKKFQFAKPPADMELPAGFCDLSNPASCKPDKEAKIAGDDSSKAN